MRTNDPVKYKAYLKQAGQAQRERHEAKKGEKKEKVLQQSQVFKQYGNQIIDINLIASIKQVPPDDLNPEGITFVYLKDGAPLVTLSPEYDKDLLKDIKLNEKEK